jgi:ribosomal protein S12 methylthiotransferase
MKTFYFVSLGCPKNRVDTEVAVGSLMAAGYSPVDAPEEADIIVVNTCSFVTAARSESVDTLLEMAEFKKGRAQRLVAMGCLGQEAAVELAESMPELDHVLGTGNFDQLPQMLQGKEASPAKSPTFLPAHAVPRVLTQSQAYAYLKVGDGCSRTCAFCTIPMIKGPFASRPIPALLDEASALVDQGVKELVLVAQDLTQFGKPGRRSLMQLLDGLERIDDLQWIRLMYLYPEGITNALLARIAAGGKVLPYLDMPVQHISDRVLRTMRRGTSARRIRRIIADIRKMVPDIALRTTLIVGHPGEDERAFNELMEFVEESRFDNLGVFTYSPEEGTVAAALPGQVPADVAQAREAALMELQRSISASKLQALVESRIQVLVQGPSEDHDWVMVGRSSRQAPEVDGLVYLDDFDGDEGSIIEVEVLDSTDYDLVARPLD